MTGGLQILGRSRPSSPEISVAVSTFQRADLLPALIAALEVQTLGKDRFELVIVDNGSTDGTASVLEKLLGTTSLSMLAMRLENNRGPAAARNVAWQHASGRYIAFTDDDCIPESGWLASGLDTIKKEKGVVVGRTVPAIPFSEAGPFSRTMNVHDVEYLATCNVFYAKADLESVGGFEEGYETPTGEDTDLAWRIRDELGRGFAFEGDAVVRHAVRPSDFLEAIRETARWYGIPFFVSRHPQARRDILHRRIFWKPSHPKALLAVAGGVLLILALAGIVPVWLVVAGVLLWLPWLRHRLRSRPLPTRRIRYRPLYLPGALAIDLAEIVAMIRGSLRYRTLVL
jgi:glycosyltransferase involved in cell wall biosynthesis